MSKALVADLQLYDTLLQLLNLLLQLANLVRRWYGTVTRSRTRCLLSSVDRKAQAMWRWLWAWSSLTVLSACLEPLELPQQHAEATQPLLGAVPPAHLLGNRLYVLMQGEGWGRWGLYDAPWCRS
jgi:hypothetical protein